MPVRHGGGCGRPPTTAGAASGIPMEKLAPGRLWFAATHSHPSRGPSARTISSVRTRNRIFNELTLARSEPPPRPAGHETDLTALSRGFVTLTPLHFDLTQRSVLTEMESWKFDLGGK